VRGVPGHVPLRPVGKRGGRPAAAAAAAAAAGGAPRHHQVADDVPFAVVAATARAQPAAAADFPDDGGGSREPCSRGGQPVCGACALPLEPPGGKKQPRRERAWRRAVGGGWSKAPRTVAGAHLEGGAAVGGAAWRWRRRRRRWRRWRCGCFSAARRRGAHPTTVQPRRRWRDRQPSKRGDGTAVRTAGASSMVNFFFA